MFQSGLCSSCSALEGQAPPFWDPGGPPASPCTQTLAWSCQPPPVSVICSHPSAGWLFFGAKERIFGVGRIFGVARLRVCIINPTMALLAVPWHPQNQGGFSWTPFTQRRRGTGHRCFSLRRLPDPLVGGPGLPGCFGPALGDVFFFPRAGSLGLFQARCLTRGRENIWPLTQRLLTTSRSALLGCRR